MEFERIYDDGLAQASFLVGCPASGELAVVDPTRDIDIYLDWAYERDYEIVSVTETHIHADYLSGARELARATGATLFVSGETEDGWHYQGLDDVGADVVELADRDHFEVGNVIIEALHTPGHTPEHMTYLITDGATTDEPVIALTGDFVFAGDLGRPDLLEKAAGEADTAREWANVLYDSVRDVFLELSDDVQVWPGHGAGSACGKALGAVPSTTVGYERKNSWWAPFFEDNNREGFIDAILSDQPESPYYFKNMKMWNRDGPDFLESLPGVDKLTPTKANAKLDEGAQLLDLRDMEAFAEGHLIGSINIPILSNLSTFVGWMVDLDQELVLLGDQSQLEEATRRLVRIGADNIGGYIPRLDGYVDEENRRTIDIVDAAEASALIEDSGAFILDARSASEHRERAIEGATNIHYGQLRKRLAELPEDKEAPILIHCSTGNRASVASGILKAHGYSNVYNFPGGVEAWEGEEG